MYNGSCELKNSMKIGTLGHVSIPFTESVHSNLSIGIPGEIMSANVAYVLLAKVG